MIEKKWVVNLEQGFHIRPANQFVQLAQTFQSEITVDKDGQRADGKSILGLMALAIDQGEEITLIAEGADEQEAMDSLTSFLIEWGEAP